MFSWLEGWVSERKQTDVINGKTSSWRDFLSGIPQSSALGSILFIPCFSEIGTDVDEGLTYNMFRFADDTTITG